MIYISIFRNALLNYRTGLNGFFVAECLFVRQLPPAARMLLDLGIYATGKSRVTRSDAPTVKLSQ